MWLCRHSPKGLILVMDRLAADISRCCVAAASRFVQQVAKKPEIYRSPRIIVVKTGRECIGALDGENRITMQSVYNLQAVNESTSLDAILGILNSRFVRFIIYKIFPAYELLFPQTNQTRLESIPMALGSEDRVTSLARLVQRILTLKKNLTSPIVQHETVVVQRQMVAIDAQIDTLVLELYELTNEEVPIVQQATAPSW